MSSMALDAEKSFRRSECRRTLTKPTSCENTDGFTKVARLTVRATSIFKHAHQESKLTEQAMFLGTVGRYVRFGKPSNWMNEVHDLQ
jgi:hypothetical protein